MNVRVQHQRLLPEFRLKSRFNFQAVEPGHPWPGRWAVGILWVFAFLALVGSGFGERFLTVEEAQSICFPEAQRFESQTVRFTAEQRRAVEKSTGVKVQNLGHRLVLAWQGSNLVGVLVLDHVLGKHEVIDYAVALDPAGTVKAIEVLVYRESYGGEIRREKWRRQFRGKHAGSALKLHDDITNISGATLSCRHVTEGVRRVVAVYRHVVQPGLVALGRLPAVPGPSEGTRPGSP